MAARSSMKVAGSALSIALKKRLNANTAAEAVKRGSKGGSYAVSMTGTDAAQTATGAALVKRLVKDSS